MTKKQLQSWLLRTSLLMVVCVLIGGAVSCSSSNSPSSPEELGLIPVEIMAPDFTLPTMTGTEITLSDLQGMPVLLNFWATWCPYCRMELPYLDAVAKQYADKATIVAIDVGESTSQVREFFGDSKVSFIVALDVDGQVASRYGVQQYLPTTSFIDSEGIIRYVKVGAFASKEELQASIDELLNY